MLIDRHANKVKTNQEPESQKFSMFHTMDWHFPVLSALFTWTSVTEAAKQRTQQPINVLIGVNLSFKIT